MKWKPYTNVILKSITAGWIGVVMGKEYFPRYLSKIIGHFIDIKLKPYPNAENS